MPKWKVTYRDESGQLADAEVEGSTIQNAPLEAPMFVDVIKHPGANPMVDLVVLRLRADDVVRIDLLED